MTSFYQMPLSEFLRQCPDFVFHLPKDFDFSDSNYVVRIDLNSHTVEVGYIEDKWFIA